MNFKFYFLKNKSEKFFVEARKEYEKRLSRYCKLTIKEYKNEDKLLKELLKEKFVVFIRNEGTMLSSEKLATDISKMEVEGLSEITVVVGIEAFDDSIYDFNSVVISISRMNLSVNFVEVVILEQIYRAYKIINGETYHK